jgi:mono/diheme cytochrome c family protein
MKLWSFRASHAAQAAKAEGWCCMTPFRIPAAIFLVSAATALALADAADAEVRDGRDLYVKYCASCHGAELQGQPEWRSPDDNGLYPAPPHDETGHTWHHDDAMLTDTITRGGQAVLDDMNVAFTSGMPGFGPVLDASEIEAILDYIKSTWPDRIREMQAQRSQDASVD